MPDDGPTQFSRRRFLQGGFALAGFGISPQIRSRSAFSLISGPGWVKLYRDDVAAFELHSECFAGKAAVWGQQSGKQILFGLDNSRHTGLDLQADAIFELWESLFGTETVIRYPALGLKFSGYAEDWLSDIGLHAFLASSVTLLESRDITVTAAPGPVILGADGTLHFTGKTTAQLRGRGISVLSRNTILCHPSIESLKASPERRTTIALDRGEEPWLFELPRGNWSYSGTDDLFASAVIEASEDDKRRTHKVLFSARVLQKSFRVISEKIPTGSDGQPVDLTMVEPRYQINLTENSHKFEAQLARRQTMQFGPLQLVLSPPQGQPALVAGDQGCCVIAKAGLVGTIDTALINPTDHPDAWDVALLTDDKSIDSYADATVKMAPTGPALNGALQFRVIRPQDALDLCFRITNVVLTLEPAPLGRLQLAHNASDPDDYSLLIADFPPQMLIMPSIKSSAMTDTDDCKTNCTPPRVDQSRLASQSRVSMRFLSNDDPPTILSLAALLEWARYPLNVAPGALQKPSDNPDSVKIPLSATEIVVPAGLSVSPDEYHGFFASSGIRYDDAVTQQWTARLSRRIETQPETSGENALTHFPVTSDRRPSVRPLLARKLDDSDDYTLHNDDLELIVAMMKQRSASARHCVLSSTGAWLDFGGMWPVLHNPDSRNRSAFHETIAGLLEQSVEFVMEAWLVPTGHRVSVIRTGKLQWCREDQNGTALLVARFVEHYKLLYHQPTKIDYDYLRKAPSTQNDVQLPFKSIELIGKETPYLEYSKADAFFKDCGNDVPSIYDYWAWVSPDPSQPPVPFEFPVEIVDRADVPHRTTMKMSLACYEQATGLKLPSPDPYLYNKNIISAYNKPANVDPTIELMQRRVAYARPTQMGNTSYPTQRIRLGANAVPDLAAAKQNETIPWYPQMKTTVLTLEQVEAFSKQASRRSDDVTRTFEFAQVYKRLPFDDVGDPKGQNRGEVILSLVKEMRAKNGGSPVKMDFNAGQGGGLAVPTTNVVALARKTGTVFSSMPDLSNLDKTLTDIGQNGMKVSEMFQGLSGIAILLGAVDLAEVLEEVSDGIEQASKLPLLAVKQLHEVEQATIGKINDILQPVLQFATTAQGYYDTCIAAIKNLDQQLPGAIQLASSLLRVIATEQRPADIAVLTKQTLDATVRDLTARLSTQIALSPLQRIQAAKYWPPADDENQPILPTLYQARDYALNSLLGKPAESIAKQLDDAIVAGVDKLQQDLDYAYALSDQVVEILADTLVIKFVDTVSTLVAAIQTADVQKAITAFEAIADIAASIPTLDQAAQNLRDGIKDSLNKTVGVCGLKQLEDRTKDLSDAVVQLGNAIPVGDTIKKALAAGGIVETTCGNVLKFVSDASEAANSIVDTVLKTEETFRQAFIQTQDDFLEAIQTVRDLLTIPKHINVHYSYATPLRNSDSGVFVAEFDGNRSQFTLDSNVLINLDGTPPQFDIKAEVTNFRLKLIPFFPFVMIGFTIARFESHNGGAPTVSCPFDAKNVQLIGPLDFVAGLAEMLHLPDGMVVQVTGAGVQIGMNIQMPAVPCGAFNIVNLSVFTAVKLDFNGGPLRVLFGFANPNQRFTMTYLFLGGGGFVNLEFAPWGLTTSPGMAVTAALEAGALAALDFGIAHGEVHIFAGIYMSLRPADLLLSGYFRAGGEFDVLGLISASIEFLMSLSYENRGGQAWLSGDCEVDIDVHVLFFSETVTLHMHHDFSGSSSS